MPASPRKLVVLDIDGVLVDRKRDKIVRRPHLSEFLEHLFSQYSVAEAIFTKQQINSLAFFWCREHCKLDPDFRKSPEVKFYSTIKIAFDIVNNAEVNACREWNLRNVVMIDDSLNKMRFNPPHTYIIIPHFDKNKPDDVLMDLTSKIAEHFNYIRDVT